MSGSTESGKKAAETLKQKYGPDYFARLGAIGGRKNDGKGGFWANPELARIAGAKGGRISHRNRKERIKGQKENEL